MGPITYCFGKEKQGEGRLISYSIPQLFFDANCFLSEKTPASIQQLPMEQQMLHTNLN